VEGVGGDRVRGSHVFFFKHGKINKREELPWLSSLEETSWTPILL